MNQIASPDAKATLNGFSSAFLFSISSSLTRPVAKIIAERRGAGWPTPSGDSFAALICRCRHGRKLIIAVREQRELRQCDRHYCAC
jgi:hypothetical protein